MNHHHVLCDSLIKKYCKISSMSSANSKQAQDNLRIFHQTYVPQFMSEKNKKKDSNV